MHKLKNDNLWGCSYNKMQNVLAAALKGESKSFCLTVNLITCLFSQINKVVNLIQTHYLKIKPEQIGDCGKQYQHLRPEIYYYPNVQSWLLFGRISINYLSKPSSYYAPNNKNS